MALSQEQFDQLPDFVKTDYEKSGETFVPKAEGKAAALKASLNDLDGKYQTVNTQLQTIQNKQNEDRTAAEAAALERLKKDGKLDEILADVERRTNETKAQFETRIEKLTKALKDDKCSLILADIASELGVFDDSRKLFAKLIKDRVDYDPDTKKEIYLDENGGATSLDKAGLIAELAKDAAFDRMRKAKTNSGGDANGNSGTGGGAAKKWKDYDDMELSNLQRNNPVEYDRLLKERNATTAGD